MQSTDVIFAFSNRIDGNMSLNYGNTSSSLKNREAFLSSLGVDYKNLICGEQVHKDGVKYVCEEDAEKGALSYESAVTQTDAFITDKKCLPIAIFTADCLSIFLYDYNTPSVAIVHAGWRSSKTGITAKTIRLMREKFNTKVKDLHATFGPAIRKCCYEVGEEFKNYFPGAVSGINNKYYLDLVKVNREQLLSLGVKDANILDNNICTYCRNDEFFSFRKEGKDCGRMMSVIMLK